MIEKKLLRHLRDAHEDKISSAAWGAATDWRGAALFTASADGVVKSWIPNQVESFDAGLVGKIHQTTVTSIATHPSRDTIVSCAGADGYISVIDDVLNAKGQRSFRALAARNCIQLKFNPKGTILAAAGGMAGLIRLYETRTWETIGTLLMDHNVKHWCPRENVISVAWSSDGKHIACGCMSGEMGVFDVEESKFLSNLGCHFAPVTAIVFSPKIPHLLFSASIDGYTRMLSVTKRTKTLHKFQAPRSTSFLCVDASLDGHSIAMGLDNGTVQLWGLENMQLLQEITTHVPHKVYEVAFSPTMDYLACVSGDKSISFHS